MKVSLSNRGGRIVSVELKKYKTYDQQPLILFDEIRD
jgi:YidC/Oxa1 family membrane protein insertase